MIPKPAFLSPFVYYEKDNVPFSGMKCNLELLFLQKNLNWNKIKLKVNKIMRNQPVFTQKLNFDKSSKKMKLKKSFEFRILHWTSFLLIPLTFLYDEYIDGPKLREQKKTHLSI